MEGTTQGLKYLTAEGVRAARRRIAPYVRKTPLEPSYELSRRAGANVYLKLESLQVTGSFKPRGSFSKLLALDEARRSKGAIASTAGGHGIGLSYAAATLGIEAEIFLPRDADARKIEAIRRNGARLTFFDSIDDAHTAAIQQARDRSLPYVSAYNDADVIAGGGTVGLEILEDLPSVDMIVVGMGGAGLISGMAIAMKDANPELNVVGVQPESNAVLVEWLRAGKPVEVDTRPSIAEGLGARIEEDSVTFPLALRYVDETIVVSDEEIKDAMAFLLEEHQLIVEPSGAAPVAAILRSPPLRHRDVVLVITGRNVSRERYTSLLGDRL
jgi:threonine dehydratase